MFQSGANKFIPNGNKLLALETVESRPILASAIYHDTSPQQNNAISPQNNAQPSQEIESLAECLSNKLHLTSTFGDADIIEIAPEVLLKHLNEKDTSSTMVVLFDLRPHELFRASHIQSSININVSSLILNRLEQKNLKHFQLDKFIDTSLSQDTLASVQTSMQQRGASVTQIVYLVYDLQEEIDSMDSELWALLKIFHDGLAGNFLNESEQDWKLKTKRHVAYLKGGFVAFRDLENASSRIVSSTRNDEYASSSRPELLETTQRINTAVGKVMGEASAMATDSPLIPFGNTSVSHSSPQLHTHRRATMLSQSTSNSTEDMTQSPLGTPGRKKSLSLLGNNSSGSSSPSVKCKKRSLSVITAQNNVVPMGLTSATKPPSAVPDTAVTAVFGSAVLSRPCGDLTEISENQPASPLTPPVSAHTAPYSQILPYLYLGSDCLPTAAKATEELKALKVTHILNMAADVCVSEDVKKNFCVEWFKLQDNIDQEIELYLRDAYTAHSQSNDNIVFVHCKAGKSRSATVVIAYLMLHKNMAFDQAYEYVKQRRPEVSPNLGFYTALRNLDKNMTSKVIELVESPNTPQTLVE